MLGSVDCGITLRGVRAPMKARSPENKATAGSSRAPAAAVIPQSPCTFWPRFVLRSAGDRPRADPRESSRLTRNTRLPRK
jgi:hypothetical protein